MTKPDVLRKFFLYQTRTRYYLVGRSKNRQHWRVLKLSRLEAAQLDAVEDPAVYSEQECKRLLAELHDGNLKHGGTSLILQVSPYSIKNRAIVRLTDR